MDLRSIYVANGVGVFLLILLCYASRTKILRHNMEDRIYSNMVLGVMLGCVMEALSYALDGRVFPGARTLNYIANTYLFTVNLVLPFILLVYVDLGLYGDTGRVWKHYKPQIAVGAVMLAVTLANLFVPICFTITEDNVYERLPLGNVYYLVILYYCATSLVLTKRYERENGARAFFNVDMFLVPILIGAGLQFMFYGLSLAWLSAAIGLVGMFMMQQNEMAYVDSLVDTYNRQFMNHILSAWISRGIRFSGVMLDVDRFKDINDRFGHSEGDEALKTVADILKKARRNREWVFRFAGDEFIVLVRTDDPGALEAYMGEVNRALEERNRGASDYAIRLSYGIGSIGDGDIDTFMKAMDGKMYEMKAGHHRAAQASA